MMVGKGAGACLVIALFLTAVSGFRQVFATPSAFGPVPFERMVVDIPADGAGGSAVRIEIRIDREGRLEKVCYNSHCTKPMRHHPILGRIGGITADRIAIFRGVVRETRGWVRLGLHFSAHDRGSDVCGDYEKHGDDRMIVITFSNDGRIHDVGIMCGLDVLYFSDGR